MGREEQRGRPAERALTAWGHPGVTVSCDNPKISNQTCFPGVPRLTRPQPLGGDGRQRDLGHRRQGDSCLRGRPSGGCPGGRPVLDPAARMGRPGAQSEDMVPGRGTSMRLSRPQGRTLGRPGRTMQRPQRTEIRKKWGVCRGRTPADSQDLLRAGDEASQVHSCERGTWVRPHSPGTQGGAARGGNRWRLGRLQVSPSRELV